MGHEGARNVRSPLELQRFADGDAAIVHFPVDLRGVEVDRMGCGAVVDELEVDRVSLAKVKYWRRHGAAERPGFERHARRDLVRDIDRFNH